MTGKRPGLGALLLAFLLFPAPQARAQSNTVEIHSQISKLRDLLGNPYSRSEDVWKAAQLFDVSKITVEGGIRGWDRPAAPPTETPDVAKLMKASRERLDELKDIPPPELRDAYGMARTLHASDRMDFAAMPENELGVYQYLAQKSELGSVRLNRLLPFIATRVGADFAFAVVIHEAAHALGHLRGLLSPAAVIAGEVSAFYAEYLWLKAADPYGEKLAYLRANLAQEQRLHPSELAAMALSYADSLAELAATGGDKKKLEEAAVRFGYREGRSRERSAPPSA